jgi:hypothetical protein
MLITFSYIYHPYPLILYSLFSLRPLSSLLSHYIYLILSIYSIISPLISLNYSLTIFLSTLIISLFIHYASSLYSITLPSIILTSHLISLSMYVTIHSIYLYTSNQIL